MWDVSGFPVSLIYGEGAGTLAYRLGLFLTPVQATVSIANAEDAATSGFDSQNKGFVVFDLNGLLTPKAQSRLSKKGSLLFLFPFSLPFLHKLSCL